MKSQTPLIVTALAITLLAASCSSSTTSGPVPSPTDSDLPTQQEQRANQTPNTIPDVRTSPRVTDTAPTPTTTTTLRYTSYNAANLNTAQQNNGKVVLFFHADWCPFCVEADKQFNSRLSEIPQNVTVLKTNYDTEAALKKKYAVTYQHTFVQIDAQGNLVSKWNGGDVENLKKYLK